jgi:hypothetical protein
MKLHFKTILGIIGCAWFLSGCVKELIPENNGYKPKVVMWAILSPDSSIKLQTSGNRGISDADVVNLPNIDLLLYDNGVKIKSLFSKTITSDSQTFDFGVKAKANHIYSIAAFNAINNTFGNSLVLDTIHRTGTEITQGENARFTYSIWDDPTHEDAYQFDVQICFEGDLIDTSSNQVISTNFLHRKPYDKYDEPVINYNLPLLTDLVVSKFTYPVTDNLFNGKKKGFVFAVQNPVNDDLFIQRKNDDPNRFDKLSCKRRYVLVRCRKITPDYYKFIVSGETNNAIFGTPYFNPTNVYSNVTGGLGLIAGMTERQDTVWIKK